MEKVKKLFWKEDYDWIEDERRWLKIGIIFFIISILLFCINIYETVRALGQANLLWELYQTLKSGPITLLFSWLLSKTKYGYIVQIFLCFISVCICRYILLFLSLAIFGF